MNIITTTSSQVKFLISVKQIDILFVFFDYSIPMRPVQARLIASVRGAGGGGANLLVKHHTNPVFFLEIPLHLRYFANT